ncbi:hypothetical protein [Aquibacillus salsiterrae]|uniref:Extracellular protein n=1 Tax=Aquibacillus salsiterrae TaxID=2950439 RepID=A0A9X3WAR0_9BACI|nr:hypothetical protein [Aquibacillus salsiterrae]MDC3415862.1 hypothetical protein [Aquibacillus salsiterrae]
MKKISFGLITMLVVFFSTQITGFAYSYGDPNKEKIADVYEQMVVKLNESPPNFADAKALFETIREEEIVLHMGEAPAQVVEKNIADEDKEAVISNMQKILTLNISRRLEALEDDFENYDLTKKLLAKAFATYKVVSPVVEEKDGELDQQIRDQFDLALESLGNPGLFGVGEKEPNKDQFIESKTFILEAIKEPFGIEDYTTGHFVDQVQKAEKAEQNEDKAGSTSNWTDYSNLKNWLPIAIIGLGIIVVIIYFIRKRKRSS